MRISPLQASLLVSSVINMALALYALKTQKLRAEILGFALLALGMGGWVGSFALLSMTRDFAFDKPNHLTGLTFVLGLFILSQVFPRGSLRRGKFLFSYVPFLLAIIVIFSGKVVESVSFGANGAIIPKQGVLFPLYGALLIVYLAWSIALLVKNFRTSEGEDRMRFTYFFTGTLLFALGAVIGDIVLPAFGISYLNMLGPLTSAGFIVFTAVAIIRHQLLDIRIIIQRGLIYSIVAGLLLALYAVLLSLAGFFVETTTNGNVVVIAGITILIGVFTAPYIEQYLRRTTDRIFFKDHYDYKQAIRTLSNIVVTSTDFDTLIRDLETELSKIMRSKMARIALYPETQEPMADSPSTANPKIGIRLDGREIGLIEPGEKRSGDLYTQEDIELLETLALHTASALERVRLYQKVSSHAAVLEERVRERTDELLQLQGREHQMIADISHNLQTPLTVLQTKLEGLKKIPKFAKDIESFQNSLTHLSSFIYDLLRFSRLEHDSAVQTERFSLSSMIRECSEEVAIIANASKISVESSIARDIFINGAPKQISESVLNIASNAVKHTKGRKIRKIAITLRKRKGFAVCSISDTGSGISPEELGHIFERYRSSASGTGIGLAITKQIVENHGGTIRVESKVNKGTKVTLMLPIVI